MRPREYFQHAPLRNESVVGAQVYSHSGEFSPQVFDLELPARGVSFQCVRKYRSAQHQMIGPLGRGWTFTYAKRIEQNGSDIFYHDGFGRIHRFVFSSVEGCFSSPDEFYAVLTAEGARFLLKQRSGDLFVFERPDSGGRLLAIEDRNGNALRFEYRANEILVTDPFERQIEITVAHDRVVELRDHAQRNWQYMYDQNDCLVEVIQPPIHGLSDLPRIRYWYDQEFRLVSITDPKGHTFLRNFYDEQDRIKQQKHGDGAFEFEYEPIDKTNTGFPVFRTQVTLKNGGLLVLKHDPIGHVVERTLFVSANSLSPEDRSGVSEGTVPLTTTSNYNRHGELVHRTYPAGDSVELVYDQEHEDPCSQGNLLRVTQIPAPGSGDASPLVTRYTYESPFHQVASVTDPRGHITTFEYDSCGNLSKKTYPIVTVQDISSDANKRGPQKIQLIDRFEYNEIGQLIRFTDPRGATIGYFYYQTSDPIGAKGPSSLQSLTQTAGGYLASIVRDPASGGHRLGDQPADLTTGFAYDDFGNVTTILDGKSNPTHLEYDAHNHLVSVTSRQPFSYTTSFRYDPNGNMIEGMLSFDHHGYDSAKQEVVFKTTAVRQGFEYNRLNNIVRRTVGAGDRETDHTSIRDAAENIVREIQPMGNVVEYSFDEQNQLVARRLGAGTEEEAEIRHTYTRNGGLSSTSSGRGTTNLYHYDGFHRYESFTNAGGTSKKQWRDEAGNVTRIQVVGDAVSLDERNQPTVTRAHPLLESCFQYDELNRIVRMDRTWRDPLTGEPLGQSQYDGKAGVVSSVVQYGDNHLPSRVWRETGNIVQLRYDGANRVSAVSDETGETVSFEYDENSNPVRIERLGPPVNEGEQRFRQVISQQFDELDRLIARSVNEDNREGFSYNALGALLEYQNPAAASVRALHDAFGRFTAGMTTATTAESVIGSHTEQKLLQRVEWDDNNRMIARVNARGNATRYQYDALNRLSRLVFADGATKRFERDAEGNIIRVVDPNRTIITNRFDDLSRLIERNVETANGEGGQVETFHYDGLNRLVAALSTGATTLRRYDSLSRLLEETQSDHTLQVRYDSAGNQIFIRYPGAQEVHKSYDLLGRVVEVRGREGLIASYSYASGARFRHQQLGGVLNTTFAYEPGKDWLSGITYRSIETGKLVEGTRYRYDAVGNRVQEVQLRRGEDSGERYFYDSVNRLVKVQYGVERLSDPASPVAREVLYELGPTGAWQLSTTRDTNGRILEQAEGTANQREAYLSLGTRRFEYDANGNRVLERNPIDRENALKRYGYDYANRLVSVETYGASGQPVRTIEYVYDGLGRQVRKRIVRDGLAKEYARVWNGSQLIEEWENSNPRKTFIYGSHTRDPIQMVVHSGQERKEYFYALNGRGWVSGLIDQQARLVEAYRYEVFGKPFLSLQGSQEVNDSVLPSIVGNPLFVHAQTYDADAGISLVGSASYDPTTAQTLTVEGKTPGPWADEYVLADEVDTGGMSGPGGVSIGGKDPYTGGLSDPFEPGKKYGNWWYFPSEDMWAWDPSAFVDELGHVAEHLGLHRIGHKIGHALGQGVGFSFVIVGVVGLEDDVGGRSPGAQENKNPGQGGSHTPSSSGSSSSGNGASPSGQPEDRPLGGRVDYGHEGGASGDSKKGSDGGSGTSTGSGDKQGSNNKSGPQGSITYEKQTNQQKNTTISDDVITGKKGGGSKMPNPVDGGGEGIDKDWWRDLPYASPLSVAEALRSPVKFDERHATPYLELGSARGTGYLIGALTPQLITVDERGEHLTLNLQGAHSTSRSSGTTTSDGWGDKPRSLAELLVARRIRDAVTSRF